MKDKTAKFTRIPVQKRSEATREKLLEAGIKLFSEQGYHRTSSKMIAREAGVAIGSFYNYFHDKRQLLLEIYRRHMKTIHDTVSDSFGEFALPGQTGNTRDLIRAVIERLLALHRFAPAMQRELAVMALSDPEFASIGQAEEEHAIERIIDLVKANDLRLRVTDFPAALAIVGQTIEAVVHTLKLYGSDLDEQRMIEATVDMICRFLFHDS